MLVEVEVGDGRANIGAIIGVVVAEGLDVGDDNDVSA
jgi:hypothetical protein